MKRFKYIGSPPATYNSTWQRGQNHRLISKRKKLIVQQINTQPANMSLNLT
ncbi:MAG: hypothetical protein HYV29_13110 [Ignavibacteriales bacterium]|nr:hypothetical protein [Ignavibacteriales bacterium]